MDEDCLYLNVYSPHVSIFLLHIHIKISVLTTGMVSWRIVMFSIHIIISFAIMHSYNNTMSVVCRDSDFGRLSHMRFDPVFPVIIFTVHIFLQKEHMMSGVNNLPLWYTQKQPPQI